MKLATKKNGSRDGQLYIVNRALTLAVDATDIAPTLQMALDNWANISPQLQNRSDALAQGKLNDAIPFEPHSYHSPLPRAFQWADGSAYVNHVELVRKARGAQMPENFWTDPLMYQGGSDAFLDPLSKIPVASESFGIDFEAEIAVITDDVPQGISEVQALEHIQLIMLVNDVSLRNLIPNELSKGFGFFHSKPSSAFSPICVTPNELGPHWKNGKVALPLVSTLNGQQVGAPNAGVDMTFGFGKLIAHAAHTRKLTAGTIIGSGTISNSDRQHGSSCLAEVRMIETIETGKPQTSFMQYGDTIRIEMFDTAEQSIFSAIEQTVVPLS